MNGGAGVLNAETRMSDTLTLEVMPSETPGDTAPEPPPPTKAEVDQAANQLGLMAQPPGTPAKNRRPKCPVKMSQRIDELNTIGRYYGADGKLMAGAIGLLTGLDQRTEELFAEFQSLIDNDEDDESWDKQSRLKAMKAKHALMDSAVQQVRLQMQIAALKQKTGRRKGRATITIMPNDEIKPPDNVAKLMNSTTEDAA